MTEHLCWCGKEFADLITFTEHRYTGCRATEPDHAPPATAPDEPTEGSDRG